MILTLSVIYLQLRKSLDWNHIKREFKLTDNSYHKFTQVSYTFSKLWKQILREDRASTFNIYLDHHLIKNNLFHILAKLTSKELLYC